MTTCTLEVSEGDYEKLNKSECCLVREFEEKATGRRFANLVYFGTREECELADSTTGFIVVFNHLELISQQIVETKDLLPPKEEP